MMTYDHMRSLLPKTIALGAGPRARRPPWFGCNPFAANTSRRAVLCGLAMGLSWSAFAAFPTNPDIVVVGAGMAGLSAARILVEPALSVVLLEARD